MTLLRVVVLLVQKKNYFGSWTLPSSDAMKPSTPREGTYASVLRPRDLLGANVQM